ncbi:nuclear transport factor 2 family protein [Marinobacter sp.]|uniref:nuclear transport factor 2 family protein n=1 Tax=Marinobacter sp. TaxID=50741 RepID=UPI00384F8F6D
MNETLTETPATPKTDVQSTVDRFRDLFNQMSRVEQRDLGTVYGADIEFTDPFTSVRGLPDLREYFSGAYANVIQCHFEFGDTLIDDQDVCLSWVMKLRHRRIRRGQEIRVDGISRLRIGNDRVILHRDYFDAGQLLYENLPLLGGAVRWIRRHAA